MPIGPYFADFACFAERLVIEIDGVQIKHVIGLQPDHATAWMFLGLALRERDPIAARVMRESIMRGGKACRPLIARDGLMLSPVPLVSRCGVGNGGIAARCSCLPYRKCRGSLGFCSGLYAYLQHVQAEGTMLSSG